MHIQALKRMSSKVVPKTLEVALQVAFEWEHIEFDRWNACRTLSSLKILNTGCLCSALGSCMIILQEETLATIINSCDLEDPFIDMNCGVFCFT